MKVLELARHVAAAHGRRSMTDDELEAVVWARTGFPSFWTTDDPQAELRHQLTAFFAGEYHCARCGLAVPTIDDWLCGPCDKAMTT